MGQRRAEALGDGIAFRCSRTHPGALQALLLKGDAFTLGREGGPALVVHQAEFAAFLGEAQIGVVLAQDKPVFGSRGEHAVRLLGAQGDQVVHQHADVGLVAARAPGFLALGAQRGVGAGEQALGTGFFITGGAIDLAGEEQPADDLGLEAVLQVARVEVVVFDRVAGTNDMGVLHATDGADDLQLHIEGQRGGDAVGVKLVGGQAFRLEENLVAVLVGEAMDLVLDGRAIARADAFDHTGIHRRAIKIAGDDFVGSCIGVGDPAAHLPRMLFLGTEERHHRDRGIAGLFGHHREIHRTAIDAWRGAGLQATDAQGQFAQALGQGDGGRIASAATGIVLQTDVDKSAEEGAGCEHHGFCVEAQTHLGHYAFDLVVFHDQVIAGLLEYPQVRLVLQDFAYRRLVEHAVGLGTGSAYGRALAAVQDAELDAAQVSGGSHGAAEGIDFLDQVALADAADGRVAAHLPEGFHIVGQQQGLHAHACSRERSLSAGMAAADHDHVKTGREVHRAPRACPGMGNRESRTV
ncbi:hypothetical protein D3C84_240100 [compost metagenome]